MTTDTSEKGLESLIVAALTTGPDEPPSDGGIAERPATYGAGWIAGDPKDYDRQYCVDLAQLSAFLQRHPAGHRHRGARRWTATTSQAQRAFLARLQSGR